MTPAATGSTRSVHTGIVASTHSARLHATPVRPGLVRSVTASSHMPATCTASAAARPSAALASASPSAATVLRAMSVASTALTAVSLSGAENIACTWPMTIGEHLRVDLVQAHALHHRDQLRVDLTAGEAAQQLLDLRGQAGRVVVVGLGVVHAGLLASG